MDTETSPVHEGACACGHVRFRMTTDPLFVHCCHCTWCQRETGTAFALNALIEADRVELIDGSVEIVDTPSASGEGQRISRCPICRVAVWSNYSGAGDLVHFVRVGTLLEPDRLPPSLVWELAYSEMWFTDNGRDMLGDDIPPGELNHARVAGRHFGFPFCHGGDIADPG